MTRERRGAPKGERPVASFWRRQKGRCFYCGKETKLEYPPRGEVVPGETAVLHLLRGEGDLPDRRVMSCKQCADEVAQQKQAQVPIEIRQARSGRGRGA